MGAVSTGISAPRGMSAGIGDPANPVRVYKELAPLVEQPQGSAEQPSVSNPNVQQGTSTVFHQPRVPALELPPIPQTESSGKMEMAGVVKDGVLRYTTHWYGSPEERLEIHSMLESWADKNEVDALIFFVATESFYRPRPKLQRMSEAEVEDPL